MATTWASRSPNGGPIACSTTSARCWRRPANDHHPHQDAKEYPVSMISLRQLLDHAADNGYGVPAFNVNNLEQIQAILEAAQETNSPVILQASAGARKYAGEAYLRHMMLAAVEA